MTTPQESRESYIDSLFSLDEILYLQKLGLYDKYVLGTISVHEIYKYLKDQGV